MNNKYCKTHIKKCGSSLNCKGCKLDPNNSILTYDEFRDEQYYWNCDSCKYCNPWADMQGVKSTCKRLDHKVYNFAKAVFHSYDCGQRHGCICADFEPRESRVWLCNHWNPEFIKEYVNRISDKATVHLCLNHEWDVRYEVLKKDFVDGSFIAENGDLKWIRKKYYKKSRKNSIGYVYLNEYQDGTIQEGANISIDWDLVNKMFK